MKFYIRVPKDSKDRIVDRIYSTYPEIVIRPIEDYLDEKLPKKIHSYGSEMVLGYHHMLRIKTKADADIIPSILAGLKDMQKDQMAVVQVLIRPLDNKWQNEGKKVLRQYEIDGIRPKKGGSPSRGIKDIIAGIRDQVANEVNQEFRQTGIDLDIDLSEGRSTSSRKTKLDRKEITVGSEKVLESGFETVIRVVGIGSYNKGNKARVKAITAAFNELDQENRFKRDIILNQRLLYTRLKNRHMYLTDRKNILTTSELANFFLRLPGAEVIDAYPDVEAIKIKEFAPPRDVETKKNILAVNTYRGITTPIGLRDKDLVRHMIIQGRTGSGKSEWAKTLFLNHIKQGRGAMVLEPHGKLADEILEIIPEERRKDVIWFDLFDPYPPQFNFCKVPKRPGIDYEDILEKTVDEAIEIFKRTFSDVWSAKNEAFISSAIKTVIEMQEGTMVDMPRLFTDKKFREYAIKKINDQQLKNFWIDNFKENANGQLNSGTESTVTSVLYKFGKFLDSKKLLRAVGQDECIDFKDILDNNKIIIFRLSRDKMSKDRINFIGGIAIKQLIVNSYARDKKMWDTPFLVFMDEAQNFIDENIKDIVHELRKYGVGLIPMHQDLEQMDKVSGLKEALYGNIGTIITFTVGQPDAPFFEKQYGPRVDQTDLKNLPSRHGYCRLLVNGETSQTFNIYTLDSPQVDKDEAINSTEEIKRNNRKGRKHFKEIDEMLRARLVDYNSYDELGSDDEETFKQKIDTEEEYSIKLEKKDEIKKQEISNLDNDNKLKLHQEESKEIIEEENDKVDELENLFKFNIIEEAAAEKEHEPPKDEKQQEAALLWKVAEENEKKNKKRW